MSLGATMQLPTKDQYHMQKKRALGEMTVFFAGRIAELLCCGDISAGASSDIERASELARRMVCEWGMSDEVGPINYREQEDSFFLGRDGVRQRAMSDATAVLIDKEVKAILDGCYKRAEKLLTKNRDKLELIAKGLLKYETLTGKDCEQILRGEEPEAARERAAEARGGEARPVVVRPELEPPPIGATPAPA
jgi:cell division protease FtsH